MKTFEERLNAKLLRNQIGMGKECREIVLETASEWLDEHRTELMTNMYSGKPDDNRSFLIIPCVTFIDRTLKPSLNKPITTERKTE